MVSHDDVFTKTLTCDDRMKTYEKNSLTYTKINYDRGFVIRLDGHKFSTFTKATFRKPFDPIFIVAMHRTLCDLMNEFRPTTGYCHSDEISLYFPPLKLLPGGKMPERDRGGKTFKLLTHTAAYCSVRLNYHLNDIIKDDGIRMHLTEKSCKEIAKSTKYFDARVMLFPKDTVNENMNYFVFRSNFDCYRNCVSTFHRYVYGNALTVDKKTKEMRSCLDDMGFSTKVPAYMLYGIYVKFEKYDTTMYVEHHKKEINVIKKRIASFTTKMSCSDEMNTFLNTSYLTPTTTSTTSASSASASSACTYVPTGIIPLDISTIDMNVVLMNTKVST